MAAVHAAIHGGAWIPSNGYDPLVNETGFFCYSVNPSLMIAQGYPTNLSQYATIFGCNMGSYPVLLYCDVLGSIGFWESNGSRWSVIKDNS